MAIVQLQSEFAAALSIAPPEYTWATKPSAAGNSGKRITITGWMAPPSDWVSDGTYWLPVGGSAVVHAPLLVNAQAQSSGLSQVASVPEWLMPSALARTPGAYIEASVYGTVANSSAAQTRTLAVGADVNKRMIVYDGNFVNAGIVDIRLGGKAHRRDTGQWARFIAGADSNAASTFSATVEADFDTNPLRLYYQGGNTDGSEVLTVHAFSLIFGVG